MENHIELTQLIINVKESLLRFGLAERTIQNYRRTGFRPIQSFFDDQKQLCYNGETLQQCLNHFQQSCNNGTTTISSLRMIRKSADLIKEYYETGNTTWRYLRDANLPQLSPSLLLHMDNYKDYMNKSNKYSQSTINKDLTYLRQFLLYCQMLNYDDVSQITKDDILKYIPFISPRYPGGLDGMLTMMRSFGRYLTSNGYTSVDINTMLKVPSTRKKRVKCGFTHDEVERILSVVDQTKIYGKRDCAMMMLAVSTGLRSVDIINLKLTDINWHRKELSIIQQKTQHSILLPLETSVGNKIAEYILEYRPESSSPYLFLRSKNPHTKLDNRSGWSIVKRYASIAGVMWSENERKGFHSFRRTIGTWMLESGTPLSTISEILGHSRVEATKPYLSISDKGLIECALSLNGIEVMEVSK